MEHRIPTTSESTPRNLLSQGYGTPGSCKFRSLPGSAWLFCESDHGIRESESWKGPLRSSCPSPSISRWGAGMASQDHTARGWRVRAGIRGSVPWPPPHRVASHHLGTRGNAAEGSFLWVKDCESKQRTWAGPPRHSGHWMRHFPLKSLWYCQQEGQSGVLGSEEGMEKANTRISLWREAIRKPTLFSCLWAVLWPGTYHCKC